MGSKKREKLIIVNRNAVISSGFGKMLGKYKVGRVVGNTRRSVKVSYSDDDGIYFELYSIVTGVRVDDLGQSSGWRVNVDNWEKEGIANLPIKSTAKTDSGASRLVRLYKENIPMEEIDGNTQDIIIEVWRDNFSGVEYLRACREFIKKGTLRAKQVPAIVPLSVVLNIAKKYKS